MEEGEPPEVLEPEPEPEPQTQTQTQPKQVEPAPEPEQAAQPEGQTQNQAAPTSQDEASQPEGESQNPGECTSAGLDAAAGGADEDSIDGAAAAPRAEASRGSMRRRGSVDLLLGIGKNIVQQATGKSQPSEERESSLTNKALERAGSSPKVGPAAGQEQEAVSDEESEDEDGVPDDAEEEDPDSWLTDEVDADGDVVPGTPVPSWVISAEGLSVIKASALLVVAEHCGWKKLENKKKKGVFEEWWFVLVQDGRDGVLLLAQYESPESLAPTAVLKLEPGKFTVSPPKEKRSEMHCWRLDVTGQHEAKYIWAARSHEDMDGWKEVLSRWEGGTEAALGRGDKLRQSKAVRLVSLPHQIAPNGMLEHSGRGPERILKGTPAPVIQALSLKCGYLRKESRKLKKFTLRWCAFIDAEHVGVTVSPVQVGIGMGLVSNPRQLGWLLVYVDAEAQTAQECVPFVSQACKVGYPKRHRPAHPYCFRFEGTKGAFAGTKYILAADVDADGASWIETFHSFSQQALADPTRVAGNASPRAKVAEARETQGDGSPRVARARSATVG